MKVAELSVPASYPKLLSEQYKYNVPENGSRAQDLRVKINGKPKYQNSIESL